MLILVTAILEQRPGHSDISPMTAPVILGLLAFPREFPSKIWLFRNILAKEHSTDRFSGSILCGKAGKIQSVFM